MAEKKYSLKKPDVDLAADARHRHIPGTSYHWRHNYIPLDARTATLFHKKKIAAELVKAGKVSIHEPEGIKTINSRGLRATRPLSIVPVSAKPKAPSARTLEDGVTERSPYDALLSPKSGDILVTPELPGSTYGDRRYRFSGSQWIKEYPVTRGGEPTGDWRKLSNASPEVLRSDVNRGNVTIAGIEPGQIESEISSRRAEYEAESLKAAQKLFGTGKAHGFRAVSGHEALTTNMTALMKAGGITDPSSTIKALTADYVPPPGKVHLIHDNGTQILIDAATAKKFDTEAVHRLAEVAHDVTTNYVHDTAAGNSTKHGPVAFHVDQFYSAGRGTNKGWSTTRNGRKRTVLGYVQRGDTQNVHLNPETALVNTKPRVTTSAAETAHEHFTAGHADFPTMAHGTMIHELGHVADNRTDHTGLTAKWGQHPEARDFHAEVFGGPLSGKVPGAKYARTDAAEGYAESFTHAVATRHATELARNKRRVDNEQKKAKRAAHDQAAAKYDAEYGFFSRVSTP